MKVRASMGRAVRRAAVAGVLLTVLVGGIFVALDLEAALLAGMPEPVEVRRGVYWRQDGGMVFDMTGCFEPRPPFEPVAAILVPFLLAMLLPQGSPTTLRLHG